MTRPLRTNSGTGIYHVMLRGINKQIIFESPLDYGKFLNLLYQMVYPIDESRKPMPPKCIIYAYCLMPNHVHLLIQEKNQNLSNIIKQIAAAYALYFNKKYERCGHLFQDRFKSESVADAAYFFTLLRYIHQNPVAGGLCEKVDDYEWSSWREYIGISLKRPAICCVSAVLRRMPLEELAGLVNDPLPKTVRILDFDKSKYTVTDQDISEFIINNYGLHQPSDLQLYDKVSRNDILKSARDFGASIRQLARLTGISVGIIRNI